MIDNKFINYLFVILLLISYSNVNCMIIDNQTLETGIQNDYPHSLFIGTFKRSMEKIGVFSTPYFIEMEPMLAKRNFYNWGLWVRDWIFYPDQHAILFSQGVNSTRDNYIFEFDPKSKQIKKFDIPYTEKPSYFYADLINNLVVTFNSSTNQIISISGFNDYLVYDLPSGFLGTSNVYDEKSGIFWIPYYDRTSSKAGYIKFNPKNGSFKDETYFEKITSYPNYFNLYNAGEYIIWFGDYTLYIIEPITGELIFYTQIYSNVTVYIGNPAIVPSPETNSIYVWDGLKAWKIDTLKWQIVYGRVCDSPVFKYIELKGEYDIKRNELVIFDSSNFHSVLIINPETGSILKQSENIQPGYFEYDINSIFDLSNRAVYYIRDFGNPKKASLATVRLDDDWDNAPTIKPQGQFVEYRPGDNFKLILDIANPADTPQDVTAYIWFWLPTGQYIFFGPNGLTTEVVGIPLTLPASLDTSISIDLFTVPQGMPSGFYNLNAVFFNNRTAVRGPMGTYNFMASQ
jgi:hypothetical protein